MSRLRDFALFRECEFCPEMVVLPAGSFLMGSPQSETGRSDDEDDRSGPGGEQVRVNVQRFAIGRFEVTGDEWTACRGCAQTIGGRGRYPATTMSWNDAQVYVRWMNEVVGGLAAMGVVYWDDVGPYRLPSEAEWEFAARSGSTARFWWGDEGPACDQDAGNGANYEECAVRTARPVGSFRANDFGLFDMHGNVWEWVSDCTSTAYASISNNGAASFLEPCEFRQNRGGSWDDSHVNLRSANRSGYVETYQSNYLGVRVARIV